MAFVNLLKHAVCLSPSRIATFMKRLFGTYSFFCWLIDSNFYRRWQVQTGFLELTQTEFAVHPSPSPLQTSHRVYADPLPLPKLPIKKVWASELNQWAMEESLVWQITIWKWYFLMAWPYYTATMDQKWFDKQNRELLSLPPNSPDLNIFEYLWNVLEKSLVLLGNLQDLKDLFLTVWCQIQQHTVSCVVHASMGPFCFDGKKGTYSILAERSKR